MENLKVMVALHDAASVESLMKLACQRANGMGAALIALSVVEVDPEVSLGTPAEDLERSAQDNLSLARQIASTFHTPISTRVIEAQIAGEAIVIQATNQAVDLIVMGYHHKHGRGEMLFGSTVRYVAEHAPCRVLVQVPPVSGRANEAAGEEKPENSRVMVALRDSSSIDSLMELACQMARGREKELTALHVVEIGSGLPLEVAAEILERPGRQMLSLAQRMASKTFGKDVFTQVVRARNAGEAIVRQARGQMIDLLVLGYHHQHGLGEMLLGSTVKYVAEHAPCRVIIQVPLVEARQKVAAVHYQLTQKSQLPFELWRV